VQKWVCGFTALRKRSPSKKVVHSQAEEMKKQRQEVVVGPDNGNDRTDAIPEKCNQT
jgi:hypothetical protein